MHTAFFSPLDVTILKHASQQLTTIYLCPAMCQMALLRRKKESAAAIPEGPDCNERAMRFETAHYHHLELQGSQADRHQRQEGTPGGPLHVAKGMEGK